MPATIVGTRLVYFASVEPEVFIRAVPVFEQAVQFVASQCWKCFLAFMEPKRSNIQFAVFAPPAPTSARMHRMREEIARVRENHFRRKHRRNVAHNLDACLS